MATITVSSGVTSSGITVTSGNVLQILSGGTAISTTVLSAGRDDVFGSANATLVSSGGVENVFAGGRTSGTFILTCHIGNRQL